MCFSVRVIRAVREVAMADCYVGACLQGTACILRLVVCDVLEQAYILSLFRNGFWFSLEGRQLREFICWEVGRPKIFRPSWHLGEHTLSGILRLSPM